eukprot:8724479-Alexandrium_andersonii.AAC.1
MSASLVGSEMCIRDRLWRLLAREREAPERPVAQHEFQKRWAYPGRCKAVSYTHLTLPTICSV